MPVCSFCGGHINDNEGLMYVQNDGKIKWFCKSKCEKNMLKLKRLPRNVRWVKS